MNKLRCHTLWHRLAWTHCGVTHTVYGVWLGLSNREIRNEHHRRLETGHARGIDASSIMKWVAERRIAGNLSKLMRAERESGVDSSLVEAAIKGEKN